MRPEGFPHEVHVQETYEDVQDTHHLQTIVNSRFIQLVTSAGLVVLKDPSEILDSSVITFEKRRFVNWSIITHMDVKVTRIPDLSLLPQDLLIPPDTTETKQSGKVN
jgi:hypothetical protein